MVLHAHTSHSNPETELRNLVERPVGVDGIFEVHLIGWYGGDEYALFIYASHALLEGQSMIALVRTLLGWMVENDQKVVKELQWEGEEVQNLAPGAFAALGGLPKGWDEESPALLDQLAKAASIKKVGRFEFTCGAYITQMSPAVLPLAQAPTHVNYNPRKNSPSAPLPR
jgi:hypothetical protein